MTGTASHNFHLPLPDRLGSRLREAAIREGLPATTVARRALEEWLDAKDREALAAEIARYAAEVAGGPEDLDPRLEAASIQAWLSAQRRSR